jgi:ubiquinone/menaquinone biosynthesis C-methylase UbiE
MEKVRSDWSSVYEKTKTDLERVGEFASGLIKKGVSCIGIDIVPEIIKKAAFYAKARGLPTQFIVADACNLPLRDECVDGYISLGVVKHFRSTVSVIKNF